LGRAFVRSFATREYGLRLKPLIVAAAAAMLAATSTAASDNSKSKINKDQLIDEVDSLQLAQLRALLAQQQAALAAAQAAQQQALAVLQAAQQYAIANAQLAIGDTLGNLERNLWAFVPLVYQAYNAAYNLYASGQAPLAVDLAGESVIQTLTSITGTQLVGAHTSLSYDANSGHWYGPQGSPPPQNTVANYIAPIMGWATADNSMQLPPLSPGLRDKLVPQIGYYQTPQGGYGQLPIDNSLTNSIIYVNYSSTVSGYLNSINSLVATLQDAVNSTQAQIDAITGQQPQSNDDSSQQQTQTANDESAGDAAAAASAEGAGMADAGGAAGD